MHTHMHTHKHAHNTTIFTHTDHAWFVRLNIECTSIAFLLYNIYILYVDIVFTTGVVQERFKHEASFQELSNNN